MIGLTTLHTVNICSIPMTVPNEITKTNKDYYISYNNYDRAIYGSDTTAIVINLTSQFLILNGDHSQQLKELNSLDECVKYFYDNITSANIRSEHGTIFKYENGKATYVEGGY